MTVSQQNNYPPPMKLSDVISIFKKDLPGLIKHSTFTPPDYRCTRAYADKTFREALLVDVAQIKGLKSL